jgi:predicted AlkP superfamily pyrophosphatase or phosphodiesterase
MLPAATLDGAFRRHCRGVPDECFPNRTGGRRGSNRWTIDIVRQVPAADLPAISVEPVLPAYDGACISALNPALRDVVSGGRGREWLPAPAREAEQIALLVLDGLGWEQLQSKKASAPTISSATGGPITSVVPTTTATALTSISTGLAPAAHGIVGYRILIDSAHDDVRRGPGRRETGDSQILNVLRWRTGAGDVRQTLPPRSLQPAPAFGGEAVAAVTRAHFVATGFSAAHLDGAVMTGWQMPSTLVVEVGRLVAGGARFVHAYYDGLDNVAHEHGLGEHYSAELRSADRLVSDIVEVLPARACLVITSDHGQVDVGRGAMMPANELLEASWLVSGEGRFRWFHARPGAAEDLMQAALEFHADKAWVRSLEQMQDERWFGGVLSKEVASRLGDVALVARDPVAFLDPADTGESRLAARHGSLTPDEMYVPLLAIAGRA